MDIGAAALDYIRRIGAVDYSAPHLDRDAVEGALDRHMIALKLPTRRIVWPGGIRSAVQLISELHGLPGPYTGSAWFAAIRGCQDTANHCPPGTSPVVAMTSARFAAFTAGVEVGQMVNVGGSATEIFNQTALDDQWVTARQAASLDHLASILLSASKSRLPDSLTTLVDAHLAGLGPFWVTPTCIIAVPRPAIWRVADRLHREDGPAVQWADGSRFWFWQGVSVPEPVVADPASITPLAIEAEPNVEVRRVMIERFGWDRYAEAVDAEVLDHDERWGTLLRRGSGREALLFLRVVNRSPEPDGSYRRYVLPVHPELRPIPDAEAGETEFGQPQPLTALNAVASTFGMGGADYARRLGAES